MNVQFKILTEKKNRETGTAPVALIFYYDGKRFLFYTQERCLEKDWDAKKQRFRKSFNGSTEANNYLESLAEKTRAAYRDSIAKGVIPSPTALKNALLPAPPVAPIPEVKPPDFFGVWADFIEAKYNEGLQENTMKSHRKVRNHLLEFHEVHQLRIDDWTEETFSLFKSFLMGNYDYHPNTIADFTKHLITFFNWARDKAKLKLSEHHAKMTKSTVEPDIIFLSYEEVVKLKECQLSEAMGKVRDTFVFACLTGLRHGDLKRLSKDQIIERDGQKIISILPNKGVSRRVKRIKRIEIPLMPLALQIIEKYQESYVKALPVLSNQKMNEYIKTIAKTAGITDMIEIVKYKEGRPFTEMVPKFQQVTCHTARHTFATISLQKGVPLQVVSNLLGHSELKTTQIYTHIVDSWKNKIMLDAWKEKD